MAAAEAFFLEPEASDYWLRIRRWEESMAKAHTAFPDDTEVAAFYALARLATAPSNAVSRSNADEAAGILLRIYERNPDHAGAMHYLVHANDVPGRERESLQITGKYESVAPRNPHALHMPTHIYTRLVDWGGVIRGNLRAAEAALEHRAGARGEFVWDEFPHAIEYLVYGYLQKGADVAAAEQLKRLRGTEQLEPTFKTAFHLASTQACYALERRARASPRAGRVAGSCETANASQRRADARGRRARGLAAYQRSIELYPKRFNGLLGAARTARAIGDKALARTFYRELLESAGGATRQSELKEAQSFVAQQR